MGYFANGTEAAEYEATYCMHCVHAGDGGCPVWLLHMLHNYKECNNPDSFIHVLIPRSNDGWNEKCAMFHPFSAYRCTETPDLFE